MPIRGESVGTAYVRILADGSDLDDSIRDELDSADPTVRAAGREHGRTYGKSFEKELAKVDFTDVSKRLSIALDKNMAVESFFNDRDFKEMSDELERHFGLAGRRAAASLEAEFKRKGNLEGFADAFDGIIARISKAEEDLGRRRDELFEENVENLRAQARSMADFEKEHHRVMANVDRDVQRITRSIDTEGSKIESALGRMQSGVLGLRGAFTSMFDKIDMDAKRYVRNVKKIDEETKHANSSLRRMARDFDKVGNVLGKAFGRGSRNNFLNFIGSVIRNINVAFAFTFRTIARVTEGVGKFAGNVVDFFTDAVKGVNDFISAVRSQGFLAALGALRVGGEGAFTTILTGGLNIVAGLAAVVIAFGIAGAAASILTSILVLLGGVIIALASTITFSLVAAFGALAPLIFPIAAIIGGIVIAVKELKDATGPLKKSMKELGDTAGGLKDVFADALLKDATKQTELLTDALKKMKPAAKNIGTALNNAFKNFVTGLDSPEFNKFLEAFGGTKEKKGFIAVAIESLGRSFTNFLAGMGNLFRGMIPIAREFLGWIEKITGQFATFGDSKKEQQGIKDFFKEAGESAKALGGFIREAVGLIKDLLTAGQDTGDSIFDDMAQGLKNVRDFFKENPQSLEDFFGDVKGFSKDLGFLIKKIVEAIDALDSKKSRERAGGVVRAIGAIILSLSQLLNAFADVGAAVVKGFFLMAVGAFNFGDAILGAMQILPGMGPLIAIARGKFNDMRNSVIDNFQDMESGIKSVRDAAGALSDVAIDLNTGPAKAKIKELSMLLAALSAQGGLGGTPIPNGLVNPDLPKNPFTPTRDPRPPGGGGGATRVINAPITVVTQDQDNAAVAQEVVNRLVATGY